MWRAMGAELSAAIYAVCLTTTIHAPEVRSYGNPAMVDETQSVLDYLPA
jgi:hypothetical protein